MVLIFRNNGASFKKAPFKFEQQHYNVLFLDLNFEYYLKQSEIKAQMKEAFCFGLTQKIYDFEPEDCLKSLYDALALSKQLKNPSFWPKVISYRLAHLLLRDASVEKDFKLILELLGEEFTHETILHINFSTIMLKIVCLHRISSISQFDHQSEIESLLKHLGVLASDRALNRNADHKGQYPLQDLHFNLLELATYFTGSNIEWYSQFSSETRLLHMETGQSLWKITTPDGYTDRIHYDRAIVQIELAQMMKDNRSSSYIILGDEQDFELKFNGQRTGGLSRGELDVMSVLIKNGGSALPTSLHFNSDRTTRRRIEKINRALSEDLIKYDPSKNLYVLSPNEKIFLLSKV